MRIVSRATLKEFWEQFSDVEQPLKAWYEEAKKADWCSPQDIKDKYRNASFVGNNRVDSRFPHPLNNLTDTVK